MAFSHVETLNTSKSLGLSSQREQTSHSGAQNHFNKQQYILETIHVTKFFTHIISLRRHCKPVRWKFPIHIVIDKLLLRSMPLSPTPFTQHFPSHCMLFKLSSFYGVPLQDSFYCVPQTFSKVSKLFKSCHCIWMYGSSSLPIIQPFELPSLAAWQQVIFRYA